jgi:molybdopterin-guanine dinucleotide biosynthesis protein A
MGRDKALLPHPRGGTWLEATLTLLAELGAPLTLLSGHRRHLELAERLGAVLRVSLTPIREAPPPEGPLRALQRLMDRYPDERLLLCPVDMPGLELACLQKLLAVALASPGRIHVAHDGRRCQPLLGLYPASVGHRRSITASVSAGERALQHWLEQVGHVTVPLPWGCVRNVNRPQELAMGSADEAVPPAPDCRRGAPPPPR